MKNDNKFGWFGHIEHTLKCAIHLFYSQVLIHQLNDIRKL